MTPPRLTFRNLEIQPSTPVQQWPIEGIQTAVERGTLPDWRRMVAVVRQDPWGDFALRLEHVLTYSRPYGTAKLLEAAIAKARNDAVAEGRQPPSNWGG